MRYYLIIHNCRKGESLITISYDNRKLHENKSAFFMYRYISYLCRTSLVLLWHVVEILEFHSLWENFDIYFGIH